MRINHWRRVFAADQTPTAEHPTYRELDPEEMTKVSGGLLAVPKAPAVAKAPRRLLAAPVSPVSATLIGIFPI